MAYQRPKLQSVTLPNVERIHIYKDPPKAVHTRQYAPVNEAEILHNIRGSQVGADRLSESISYIARGTNPMTDLNFSNNSNNGANTLHLPRGSTTLPYKIEVVRPPLFTLDRLQPYSRQRFLNPAVTTNPIIPGFGVGSDTTYQFDRTPAKNAVSVARNTQTIQANPTLTYKIALPGDIFGDNTEVTESTSGYRSAKKVLTGSWHTNIGSTATESVDPKLNREVTPQGTVIISPLHTNANTARTTNIVMSQANATDSTIAVSATKSEAEMLVKQYLRPNFEIVFTDSATKYTFAPKGTTQEKDTIAIQSALGAPLQVYDSSSGTPVKVKDYQWKIIQSNSGSDILSITITPNNDITQQGLRNLSLDSKVSAGNVTSQASSQTIGGAPQLSYQGVEGFGIRHTKDEDKIMNLSANSGLQSSMLESHNYQGGSSMEERQHAISTSHLRKEARKARAIDVRGNVGIHSSANLPFEPERILRLKKDSLPSRV